MGQADSAPAGDIPSSPSVASPAAPVSLFALWRVFFWIGLFSFGGGLMPWIHREVVTARGWMKNEQFLVGVALSQILPGVNSTNMAVYVGQRSRGLAGATVAVVAMLTGPFLVMLLAALSYRIVLGVPWLHAAMAGVAAAAIGMLLRFAYPPCRRSSPASCRSWSHWRHSSPSAF
ncbi:chromate transporter [Roseiarcaceae bacterium H3SJ34-1]|uniref:chromate transporter n=1 Tax=Terripilifer ovatus TaxID=3032367 RepID=UPI003AB95603|nr:chromate transporter [Roseiarcaceae bacterium H3SJ34-1]